MDSGVHCCSSMPSEDQDRFQAQQFNDGYSMTKSLFVYGGVACVSRLHLAHGVQRFWMRCFRLLRGLDNRILELCDYVPLVLPTLRLRYDRVCFCLVSRSCHPRFTPVSCPLSVSFAMSDKGRGHLLHQCEMIRRIPTNPPSRIDHNRNALRLAFFSYSMRMCC